MKLYYFPGACSLADHILLEWIGTPYEAIKLTHAGTKAPEYLALNPHGTVPLLIDGDFMLNQNLAILYYLAEQHPAARLIGDGTPRGRADVLRWVSYLNSDVHPAFKPLFKPGVFHSDPAIARVIADGACARVREHLDSIESRLEGRDWLVDNRSIADPYLFVLLRWAQKFQIFSTAFGNLTRFFARMHADAGVRAAIIVEEGGIDG